MINQYEAHCLCAILTNGFRGQALVAGKKMSPIFVLIALYQFIFLSTQLVRNGPGKALNI